MIDELIVLALVVRGTVCIPDELSDSTDCGGLAQVLFHSVSNGRSFHDRWALWFLGAEFRKSYGRLVAIGVTLQQMQQLAGTNPSRYSPTRIFRNLRRRSNASRPSATL